MINGLNHSFSPNYNCILLENFKLFHIHKLLSIRRDHLKRIWKLYQNNSSQIYDFGTGFKHISKSILIRKIQNVFMYYI
ncbi:hypothetical protein B2G50_07645 [Leptospira interrogans serovar Canicola]|nr:hypothetical protein B2G50_07645 [Leptospira interrogans serovar Canicola]